MGDKNSIEATTSQAIATAVNSKAAEKLAGALGGLVDLGHKTVDYLAGAKRIAAVSDAKAQGALHIARVEAEIEMLRAETGDYVRDREMRKTINRRSIVSEAYKALPAPNVPISDEQPAKGFVPGGLDEFDGINDPDIHKIVGRLIAGEVVSPGSFPRKTIRVLRDLESRDFELFRSLCRFSWIIGELTPLIFSANDPFYTALGLNFNKLKELESLGLISFEAIGGYARQGLPQRFHVLYGNIVVQLVLKEGVDQLSTGQAMFTDAGRRLAGLTEAQLVPEGIEFVLKKWKDEGHQADVVAIAQTPQTTKAA